ncbi:hypothetical protein ACIBEH_21330 [Nocardia salmonicida]|uniref:hypothetical protein n=1 Tax=Nocardia salmonicida TaxID=53431 RepID=UPI0037874F62
MVVRADRIADEFDVVFSDGVRTAAGILHDDDGSAALDVVGYATAAGTMLPGRIWPIISIEDVGSEVNIALGPTCGEHGVAVMRDVLGTSAS